MKSITVELGGKSPLIALIHADLENAVNRAMMSSFFFSGQVRTNVTWVLIPKYREQEFEERLLEKTEFTQPGNLVDFHTNLGPLVTEIQYKKVLSYFNHGISNDGAKLLYRYGGPEEPKAMKGFEGEYWIQTTVFTDCNDALKIVREKTFGPVLNIFTYDTAEEAILRSSNTSLGLAVGIFHPRP